MSLIVPIPYVIQINYPTANLDFDGNCTLSDHGDGPVISKWEVPNVTKPTKKRLIELQTDENTIQKYQFILNSWANAPILAELDKIDAKSIRALREPGEVSTFILSSLAEEASALRSQLLPTK